MKKHTDPLGRILLRHGVLSELQVGDVLEQQARPLPFASVCHLLGYADEEVLAHCLSIQRGVPGVVLGRSVICLSALRDIPSEIARKYLILPMMEDDLHLFVAVDNPEETGILQEVQFVRGKTVVPHIAVQVVLARVIRDCFDAFHAGREYWFGPQAGPSLTLEPRGHVWVVSDVDQLPDDPVVEAEMSPASESTAELDEADLLEVDDSDEAIEDIAEEYKAGMLDRGSRGARAAQGETGPRILLADADVASRHALSRALDAAGYAVSVAETGVEAVRQLRAGAPDAVLVDLMLPESSGFQLCRTIKQSERFRNTRVVLLSSPFDGARVTDAMLNQYGADAYFEKPVHAEGLLHALEALLGASPGLTATAAAGFGRPQPDAPAVPNLPTALTAEVAGEPDEASFAQALELYRDGQIDDAVKVLRAAIKNDPLSARHRFVLANLLQKRGQLYEAIDEYEAVAQLRPDYFPALSRLAYVYYKKGFTAKAVATWRRALPHCTDPSLRENIERLMAKLEEEMRGGAD